VITKLLRNAFGAAMRPPKGRSSSPSTFVEREGVDYHNPPKGRSYNPSTFEEREGVD